MHASITILGSDVLRILVFIRDLKAFKLEHAALAIDFKGSLFWDSLYNAPCILAIAIHLKNNLTLILNSFILNYYY